MSVGFKHHDTLRLFIEVAQHSSFSDAASALNMTKGAVSYQVKTLETQFGLKLFKRNPRGVELTEAGQHLAKVSRPHFRSLELELDALRGSGTKSLTVGMSSYFASRWLSPRLMSFMQKHPDVQLRIQPMTQLFNLEQQGVDLAIRWGSGAWNDVQITPFMAMPAWPVGNSETAKRVRKVGLERAFSELTLLRDHDESHAWSDWLDAAGLPHQTRKDTLIIPDPNVRVQAVIDGQGIALNDDLVAREIDEGQLVRLSQVELNAYGYFLARPLTDASPESVDAFVQWLQQL